PDPLGVIYFRDADPLFAASEHMKEPLLARPAEAELRGESRSGYGDRVFAGSGMKAVSLAAVPLVSGSITTGTLGFIKEGDRAWDDDEINALKLIATLLVQVNARIRAEEDLRYAAYHDALTGLASRRALFEYLDDRL